MMEAREYEGYWKDQTFIPKETMDSLGETYRVVLKVIEKVNTEEKSTKKTYEMSMQERERWIEQLEQIGNGTVEQMFEEITRAKMKKPIDLRG